jgi:hypothetical protein
VQQLGRRRFATERSSAHTLPTEYWKRKKQKQPEVKGEGNMRDTSKLNEEKLKLK